MPEAIRKATEQAKRSMIRVPLREGRTLHHDIDGRFGAGQVLLRAAPAGTGIIAGGPMRAIFEALGVQDVVAKSIGSSNPHNMIKATFEALKTIEGPRTVAARRGKKVSELSGRPPKAEAAKMPRPRPRRPRMAEETKAADAGRRKAGARKEARRAQAGSEGCAEKPAAKASTKATAAKAKAEGQEGGPDGDRDQTGSPIGRSPISARR